MRFGSVVALYRAVSVRKQIETLSIQYTGLAKCPSLDVILTEPTGRVVRHVEIGDSDQFLKNKKLLTVINFQLKLRTVALGGYIHDSLYQITSTESSG